MPDPQGAAAIRCLDGLRAVVARVNWAALEYEHAELRRIRAWALAQQPVQPGDHVTVPSPDAALALTEAGVHPDEDIDRSGRGTVAELYLTPEGTWRAQVVLDALRARGYLIPGDDRVSVPVGDLTRHAAAEGVGR